MGIWKKEKYTSETLNENIEVETLIIGGGITGLLTAYELKNKNICLVEKNKILEGVTQNTTAKITYLQENIYTKIKKLKDEKTAKLHLESQIEGMNKLIDIIKKEKINCDLTKTPSYIFASNKQSVKKLKKEYQFLKKEGINIEKCKMPANIRSYGTCKVENTYTYNPLKFLTEIYKILTKNNIKIYEQTKITSIKKENEYYICKTENNIIKAKKVVLACHYPFFNFPLFFPLKCSVEKSHIIISKINEYKNISCININKPTYSLRYYKDNGNNYQISLSSSHNIAYKLNDEECFENVKKLFKLEEENIIMKYTNTDIITPDYLPYIGEIKKGLYISCGFNTWGMTNSIISSTIIKDIIDEIPNKYKNIYNPKRISLANIIKLPYYIFNNTKSYLSSKLIKNKPWYSEKIKIKNGIGIYTDEEGKEHKVKNKCPHLGCSLIFNETEKTWDCPCHSSRFDIDGQCIKGPSNQNIKLK